jgi:hypothetical protein
MICITHTTPGHVEPDRWFLAHDMAEMAGRISAAGDSQFAQSLRLMEAAPRGVTNMGYGWVMVAGGKSR